ncbi:Quinone oxidoreductase 2 [Vibrio aerogenes CECT 7868]|uniref:Quinone oxidoreductase 2 n=1 Tax=Vibrio aerogenes CECT 7868 TaxID=1216006 RepID=A0A1M5ZE48_9VIBR|nr:SDR family oxidoreductase [Vibrio aerogenes]SHI22476.1 Quinone oxidoreductase 2 [Vibrio aerogenes CECT 7868]
MYLVTGASGQLGRLIVQSLQDKGVPANQIVAAVRSPEKVQDLADAGIVVRQADYNDTASLAAAFAGVNKVVLVSSSEVGQRAPQHKNIIDAAKEAGVELLAYTSLLKSDASLMMLADEHNATEAMLAESGIPYVLLRNSWYLENYTGTAAMAVEHGAVLGCAGDGKYAMASRADYAEAAAVVMTTEGHAGKVYELAGDEAVTLAEYAAAVAEVYGKPVVYQELPEQEYVKVLTEMGLPEGFAQVLANSDIGASKGALFDDSKTLSGLIGHPTTSLKDALKAALA